MYHSTLASRVTKKKNKADSVGVLAESVLRVVDTGEASRSSRLDITRFVRPPTLNPEP